jgi:hypothetical protein
MITKASGLGASNFSSIPGLTAKLPAAVVTASAARPCSAPRPTGRMQTLAPPPPRRPWSWLRPHFALRPPSRAGFRQRRGGGGSPARGPRGTRGAAETATWRSRGCACARRRRRMMRGESGTGPAPRGPSATACAGAEEHRCSRMSFLTRVSRLGSNMSGDGGRAEHRF